MSASCAVATAFDHLSGASIAWLVRVRSFLFDDVLFERAHAPISVHQPEVRRRRSARRPNVNQRVDEFPERLRVERIEHTLRESVLQIALAREERQQLGRRARRKRRAVTQHR